VRLVKSLDEPVEVEFFVTRGLPTFDRFANALGALLREYERVSRGKFRLSVLDARRQDVRECAETFGLSPVTLGDEVGSVAARGYLGLAFRYRGEHAAIPEMNPQRRRGFEFWITNTIRELRDKADGRTRRIGVISGKQELSLSASLLVVAQSAPTVERIIEQAFPCYELE